MLDQSISERNVKVLSSNIWRKWEPTKPFDLFIYETWLNLDSKLISDGYSFSKFNSFKIADKDTYEFGLPEDEIVSKKLNDNIKRLFKINTCDRHAIVKQVISLLRDTQPIKIIRLDVKDFYESINRKDILHYVVNEFLLSHQNRSVLKSWDKLLSEMGINGLPRGMSLSSTLSEIRMRPFDREVRKLESVYYYARFVDDIIIMFSGNEKELLDRIESILNNSSPELRFNDKTRLINLDNKGGCNFKLDYLGYEIAASNVINNKNKHKSRCVTVKISNKKIKKIKFRVRRAFSSFVRTRNFNLLIARLEFLTGNQYIIGDIDRTRLKSGIYYNYPLINDYTQLKELDGFYQKLINSRGGVVSQAIQYISSCDNKSNGNRLDKVSKLSFLFGYKNRVMNSFNRKESRNIKRCW